MSGTKQGRSAKGTSKDPRGEGRLRPRGEKPEEATRDQGRMVRLNECLLGFGADPTENINRLVALCGRELQATCALYNRLEGSHLCALGRWNAPADLPLADTAEGHICFDVVRRNAPDVCVIRHLPQTAYAETDPNVRRYGLQTYVGKTVSFAGTGVGSLCVVYREDRVPDAGDLQLLEIVASAIGVEEARLRSIGDLQRRTQQLEAIRTISAETTRELDLRTVLQLIGRRLSEQVGYGRGGVCLWDEAAQRLIPHTVLDLPDRERFGLQLGKGVAGRVAERREGLIVNDYRTWPGAPPEVLVRSKVTAMMAEPLLYRDRLVGVIHMDTEEPGVAFTEADRELLRLFASQAAIAIEHARLFHAQQQAYQDLQRAQEELVRTEKLRALGQMSAGIAHDLNNKLAIILGQAELLRLRWRMPGTQERFQALEAAVLEAAEVVRRLHEFARQEETAELVPLSLRDAVQEAMELTRPRWEDEPQQRGVKIRVEMAVDRLPPILGRAAELREALTTLIFNAADAMPDGGTLSFAGRTDSSGVILAVADTGHGMPEDVRQRAFEPFFTTKGRKGSGLGLSMAYSIMRRHGGNISLDSVPGQGTTVTLRFQPAPPEDAGSAHAGLTFPARRLLVIDDETAVRRTLVELLRDAGHTVAEADSGSAGLACLAEGSVDCVITDLGMPGMSGWDVAQRVKAMDPRLPVLLLTGWGQQVSPAAPGRACVDRVLGKPIQSGELRRVIAELTASLGEDQAGATAEG
jgi:signal transduction histidine kinase/ActR/RegA family two-component response regulator